MVKYIRIVRAIPHNMVTEVKTDSTPKAAIAQKKEREYCKNEKEGEKKRLLEGFIRIPAERYTDAEGRKNCRRL